MSGLDNSNPVIRVSDTEITSTFGGKLVSTPLGLASCTVYPSLLEFRRFQDHGVQIVRIFLVGTHADWLVNQTYESTTTGTSQSGLSLNTLSQWLTTAQQVLDEVSGKKSSAGERGESDSSLTPDFPNLAALVNRVAHPKEVSDANRDVSCEEDDEEDDKFGDPKTWSALDQRNPTL